MSNAIQVQIEGLPAVQALIERLENPDLRPLMDALVSEVESQTRRRIQDEKRSPDGTPWPAWSPDYAAKRHGGQSLLQGDGDLLDSITGFVHLDGSEGEVGSNLVYAAIHNRGGPAGHNHAVEMPKRQYLGFSGDNLADLETVAESWAEGLLR